MKATLTELHRSTRKVIRPAIQGQDKIVLTEHGEPCAQITPFVERKVVTEEDLLNSDISDQAILDSIAESRE